MRLIAVSLMLVSASSLLAQTAPPLRVRALKIHVEDMGRAMDFFGNKLGFRIEDATRSGWREVRGLDDEAAVILGALPRLERAAENDTGLGFTLQVNDLDEALTRLQGRGIDFGSDQKRTEGVGQAIYLRDPFGRRISLMHQTIRKVEPFEEPRLYNFGFLVPDMKAARAFYVDRLGFVVRTERFLPRDLPLGENGGRFAFMLHERPNVRALDRPRFAPFNMLVLESPDLGATEKQLRAAGVPVWKRGGAILVADPFNNILEIVEAARVGT